MSGKLTVGDALLCQEPFQLILPFSELVEATNEQAQSGIHLDEQRILTNLVLSVSQPWSFDISVGERTLKCESQVGGSVRYTETTVKPA